MDVLVGSTGFVGSNLKASHHFDLNVHSRNIELSYGTKPELVVYAGVTGTKYLANLNPESDRTIVEHARANLRRINAKKVVLISTVDVYGDTRGKDELSEPGGPNITAYGYNRLLLEQWVRIDYPTATIIRLPALYGIGIKKNFIYDLINLTPAKLTAPNYETLSSSSELVRQSYEPSADGFWRLKSSSNRKALRSWFMNQPLNALSFTNGNSTFQFLNLNSLWNIVRRAVDRDVPLLNVVPPPLSARQVFESVSNRMWTNSSHATPIFYDLRSIYAPDENHASWYSGTESGELEDLRDFIRESVRRAYGYEAI